MITLQDLGYGAATSLPQSLIWCAQVNEQLMDCMPPACFTNAFAAFGRWCNAWFSDWLPHWRRICRAKAELHHGMCCSLCFQLLCACHNLGIL